MPKTAIDIDDGLLAEASKILGTPTMKATVNTALGEVVMKHRREEATRRLLENAREGSYDPLASPELVAEAWR